MFYFQKEKEKPSARKGKKGSRRAPVDPKGNYQHEWRLV